jgi:DNA-binding MarR family transcriptional regulator
LETHPTSDPEFGSLVRQLLHRRELAASRHRAAVARLLGLSDREMLAVAYLAQRGTLAPSELGSLLQLSSAGVTTMVQRLEEAGRIVRERHPTDRRSILMRLSPKLIERAEQALRPLVTDLQQLAEGLPPDERTVVARFLGRVVRISEEHAERAVRESDSRPGTPPLLHPGLWA